MSRRRFLLTPELMVRLVSLLTEPEDLELYEYASRHGSGPDSIEFAYRASDWIARRFNLTPHVPADTPDDAVLIMKRILPGEHE